MAVAGQPLWSQLTASARAAIEWAAACETTSRNVGTRAILLGLLLIPGRDSSLRILRRHAGIPEPDLIEAMRTATGVAIDPSPRSRASLDDFPPLTDNAMACLRRAESLRRDTRRRQIDMDCLLGGVLLTGGSANTGLAKLISHDQIRELASLFVQWLSHADMPLDVFLPDLVNREVSPVGDVNQTSRIDTSFRRDRGSTELVLARVRNDSEQADDLIGVDADARALAALVASRNVEPPLAVGLYGPWGSGKTYFMRRVENHVDQIVGARRDDEVFCTKIAHVWFNAWHYAEGNLWASLIEHVFASLDDQKSSYQTEIEATVTKLTGAKALADEAKAAVSTAEQGVSAAVDELQQVRSRREQALLRASQIQTRDLWASIELTAEEQGLAEKLLQASEGLGLPKVAKSSRELWQRAREVEALGSRTLVLATSGNIFWSPLALAVYALVIVGGATWFLSTAVDIDRWTATAALVLGPIATLLSSAAAWLGRQSHLARRFLRPAEQLQARLQQRQEDAQAAFAAELRECQDALRVAEAEQVAAYEAVRSAEADLLALKAEAERLTGTRLLHRYLKERASSDDYRQYLGVVALARHDLADLQDYLHRARADSSVDLRLDRIVLYIDDLDRCEPDRVADVLDAIHLLLAMPLFVVVVGVNPSWLELSLRRRHPVLLGRRSASTSSTTAGDYLEKIFQLTYSLRRLDAAEAGTFLMGLARAAEPATPAQVWPASADDVIGPAHGDRQVFSNDDGQSRDATLEGARSGMVSPDLLARALSMSQDEIQSLPSVAALVSSSPRRAQRFLNLYMVLRARYQPGPDDYDGPGLLLLSALATGIPRSLARMLNAARDQSTDRRTIIEALNDSIDENSDETRRWVDFLAHVERTDMSETWRFEATTVSRLVAWLDNAWPYLPMSFQDALGSPVGPTRRL